jgi:branched-chain amino acid transport system substrate-binding protein
MKRIATLGVALGFAFALAQSASAQVKFGVGGPITGPNAATGAQMKNGVEQAAADINAAGGILGNKLSVEFGDDVSDPKPKVTERNMWNIFRTCGRDDQQGKVAGGYILAHFKGKKIAFVHDKTTYGKGLADETLKAIQAGGMKEVLYEGVNTGDKDYSALISKIKQAGPDLVYFGGLYTEGGLIVRQMRDQGVKAPLMGGDGITSDEFATVGGPGVEGTLMTYGPDPRNRPEAKAAVAEFRKKGFEPEAYTLYSYAGVQIIKQAAEAAKSIDPKKVAEQMHSGKHFSTVLGDMAYDKKGDITKLDYVMYIWKKDPSGKISYVECPASGCSM